MQEGKGFYAGRKDSMDNQRKHPRYRGGPEKGFLTDQGGFDIRVVLLDICLEGAGFSMDDPLFDDRVEPGRRFVFKAGPEAGPMSRILNRHSLAVAWADTNRFGCRTEIPVDECDNGLALRLLEEANGKA